MQNSKRNDKGNSLIDIIKDFVVVDIETTGLDPRYDEIIEISALKIRNNEIVGTFSELIKPTYEIDEFITELTGITNDMLNEANQINVVLPKFMEFVGTDIIIGHNVNFDINFLYDNLLECNESTLNNDFIDTLRIARRVLKDLKHHRLDDLTMYFNITQRDKHRALNDCKLTLEVYLKLCDVINNEFGGIEELKNSLKSSKNYDYIRAKDIVAKTNEFDKDNLLFDANVVFTGALEKMTRKDAMQIVANIGGHCQDRVTKDTNYLILGNLDYAKNIKDGKSKKQKYAEELKLKGQDIEILSENVFYDLIP